MKRIAIDVTPLTSEHQYRGIGNYTRKLVDALQKYDKNYEYLLTSKGQKIPPCDLLHYPYFEPFYLTLPMIKQVKTVVTVHDMIPFVFADQYPRGIRGELKWQIQKKSLMGVKAIITDSENSKEDIMRFTSYPKEKIYVIPLAAGEAFRELPKDAEKLTSAKKTYHLPDTFFLYVGDVNVNKNIPRLIEAFHDVSKEHKDAHLVLIGRAFGNTHLPETKEIMHIVKTLDLEKRVIRISELATDDEDDLVSIYNLATCYIQPSLYEGFGIPVLEAMACGVPCLVAQTSSLPEVAGTAAVYLDPFDREDMARKMEYMLTVDAKDYDALKKRSLDQAKKFHWEKTGRETTRVYEEVCRT